MLQLHLSDQQFYCLLKCVLYQRFDGNMHILLFCCATLWYISSYSHSPAPWSFKSLLISNSQKTLVISPWRAANRITIMIYFGDNSLGFWVLYCVADSREVWATTQGPFRYENITKHICNSRLELHTEWYSKLVWLSQVCIYLRHLFYDTLKSNVQYSKQNVYSYTW